jgi:L-rhamnose isomerase/sugar isomerase
MQLEKYKIDEINNQAQAAHQRKFDFVAEGVSNLDDVMTKLAAFNIAIPSWALGTGGTRFGRFSGGENRAR